MFYNKNEYIIIIIVITMSTNMWLFVCFLIMAHYVQIIVDTTQYAILIYIDVAQSSVVIDQF